MITDEHVVLLDAPIQCMVTVIYYLVSSARQRNILFITNVLKLLIGGSIADHVGVSTPTKRSCLRG